MKIFGEDNQGKNICIYFEVSLYSDFYEEIPEDLLSLDKFGRLFNYEHLINLNILLYIQN